MKNPPNWGLTLVGVVLIIVGAALVAGCQEPTPPMTDPTTVPDRTGFETDSGAVTVPTPPPGADEGHLGDPEAVPDLTPVDNGRDPDWDCTPTGNTAIDDWKRDAKCGGKLDGE